MFTKEFIKETILLSPLSVLLSESEIDKVVEDIYQRYCHEPQEKNYKAGVNGEPEEFG